LKDDLEKIRRDLEEKEKVREELIKLSRDLRLNASKAIANIHANKMEKTEEYLRKAENLLKKVEEYRKYPELFYLAHDALQEFVEAFVFKHIVENMKLPEKLPFQIPQPVLGGLADVIGELRRYSLSLMVKEEDLNKIRRIIEIMEEIYYTLIEFDFHDRLTGNLRPKLDVARNSIERTKSDFIAARISRSVSHSFRSLPSRTRNTAGDP